MPSKMVVSRKWKNPEIEVYFNNQEVGASIALDDYLSILVEEIGNPTLLVTKQQLKQKLLDASLVVEKELKDSTRYL